MLSLPSSTPQTSLSILHPPELLALHALCLGTRPFEGRVGARATVPTRTDARETGLLLGAWEMWVQFEP